MKSFAFLIHPLDIKDIYRKFPSARILPDRLAERLLRLVHPFKISHITGLRSPYSEAEGYFIVCPLTSRQMLELPEDLVLQKIIKAGKVAEKLGAKIFGLGAFSSVVGDAGITVAKNLDIAVTTGNSLTVATALESAKKAAQIMGHKLEHTHAVIVGATGSIGKICAAMLTPQVEQMTLVARNQANLQELAAKINKQCGKEVHITSDIKQALSQGQIILTVTSAVDTLIGPQDLLPGAIVCDVSRPRNVSLQVAQERNDVLVLEGGVMEVPGEVNFNFNFGFPPGMSYACMAETMILALEERYENFSLGRDLELNRVQEIWQLAQKHQFKLAGFRSFEKALTESEIEQIRVNALAKGMKIV